MDLLLVTWPCIYLNWIENHLISKIKWIRLTVLWTTLASLINYHVKSQNTSSPMTQPLTFRQNLVTSWKRESPKPTLSYAQYKSSKNLFEWTTSPTASCTLKSWITNYKRNKPSNILIGMLSTDMITKSLLKLSVKWKPF